MDRQWVISYGSAVQKLVRESFWFIRRERNSVNPEQQNKVEEKHVSLGSNSKAAEVLCCLLKHRMYFNETWHWDEITPIFFLPACAGRELKITMAIWISRWQVLIKESLPCRYCNIKSPWNGALRMYLKSFPYVLM